MRALVKAKPERGLWLQDVPKPEIGPNDVLIRVTKAAICGTDLHIYKWDDWAQRTIKPPLVIGHEFTGEVAAVGANVKGIALGARVSGEGHIACGQCRNCLGGRRHICKDTQGVGIQRPGAFADFVSIPASNVWLADPAIPTETLAYFDPLGNAVHTALAFDLVGEDVLITGAGPIGLMAIAICRHAGARNIAICDVNPYRLELARKMGATLAFNSKEMTPRQAVSALGMREGFDVGLEMSGHPDAFRSMLEAMHHGGSIALLGILPAGAGIDWDKVIFKGLTLRGIYGREMFETWYKMSVLIQSGVDVSPVLTHRFPAERFEEAFETVASGNSGKVILEWAEPAATSPPPPARGENAGPWRGIHSV